MVEITIKELKKSPLIIKDIRWDVTPRIFMSPSSAGKGREGERIDVAHGYMLYVDLMNERPALVLMQLKPITSRTVGYLHDIPGDLLKEAMECTGPDCVGGMYPLTEKLEGWLKKELGLA